MANTNIENKISTTDRRERLQTLQNNMNDLEYRMNKLCEDVYFEIIVKPQEQASKSIKRFVIDPKNMEFGDSSEEATVEAIYHPLQMQVQRIKRLQKHYKIINSIAKSRFALIKDKYKDNKNVVVVLERKLQPEEDFTSASESALSEDTVPESKTESCETKSASEYGSETNTKTETESEESDIEKTSTEQFDVEHEQQLQQLFSDLKLDRIIAESINQTMKWRCIINFTQELLELVFGSEMLATHTLFHRSGTDENWEICTESQLNPYKTAYVIKVVCSKHNVRSKDVRTIIGTLCANAAKEYQKKQT